MGRVIGRGVDWGEVASDESGRVGIHRHEMPRGGGGGVGLAGERGTGRGFKVIGKCFVRFMRSVIIGRRRRVTPYITHLSYGRQATSSGSPCRH